MSAHTDAQLKTMTMSFTEMLRKTLIESGYKVTEAFESGNVTDGPALTLEATGLADVTFNIEIAGPAYKGDWTR